MLKMDNGFYITDDDCMQCCKPLENRKFILIQEVWLDTCGNDKRAKNAKTESDNYMVVADTIDVANMELEDVFDAIAGYYDSLECLENSYNSQLGKPDIDQIIAECEFESNPYCNYKYQSEVVSWEDAENIIQQFVNSNGEMNFN